MSSASGDASSRSCLSIVATPIGHLDDITLRALRVLKEAELILAEDTRRTRVLLEHHAIATRAQSLHAHTSDEEIARRVDELAEGRHFALVSDAGTPLVSDPGSALVRQALDRGVRIEPIPGPSAVTTALVASGLGGGEFRFVGFLPRKGPRRREAVVRILDDASVTVLFEAPNRLRATLEELAKASPERPAAVCRELTKRFEEIARGSLGQLAEQFKDGARGEITLVVAGAPARDDTWSEEDVLRRVRALREEGLPASRIAKQVAKESGWNRAAVFDQVPKG